MDASPQETENALKKELTKVKDQVTAIKDRTAEVHHGKCLATAAKRHHVPQWTNWCIVELVHLCETWVPLGPHRLGSRPSPTSGSGLPEDLPPVSGPNRPDWLPTRPPEDPPEDSPDDLIHYDLKTWRTRQRPWWTS
jgi:hypothetical protein